MVAKIASDEKKPDGQTYIPPTRQAWKSEKTGLWIRVDHGETEWEDDIPLINPGVS